MAGYKFLIDTNVVIGLEDDKAVDASVAELARICSESAVGIFVDGANYDDVSRDDDEIRRAVTLSKLQKFQRLRDLPRLSIEELSQQFGVIKNANDHSDARLLLALKASAVDFVITQDGGLHKRANRIGLGASVLTVDDALNWLHRTFKKVRIELPGVVEVKAYQIDRSAPFFESLRSDYPHFERWFEKCCQEHRDCWQLKIDGQLAGLVVRKEETHSEAQTKHAGPKILKICTLKVDDKYRGEKFGELFLKQIFWFAQSNRFDLLYLTVYPKHTFLIELLGFYGFEPTGTTKLGELVMERPMLHGPLPSDAENPLEFAKKFYPRFQDGSQIRKFCVPILPQYHQKLFPEIAFVSNLPLFPSKKFDLRHAQGSQKKPGNTIRKVYVCRSKTTRLRPGDLLFFYMSKDEDYAATQSITTVGVVEKTALANSVEELVRLTAKRSVYSETELENWITAAESPVFVIDFLLVGHIEPEIALGDLLESGIFKRHPPQSILELDEPRYLPLREKINIGPH
jgi:GNAT superfamily N-acetyltransferase